MVDPDLWIMAAKCEMEDRNSSESARHLFLRALRFHPENKKVYQEVSYGNVLHEENSVSHSLEVQIKGLVRFRKTPKLIVWKIWCFQSEFSKWSP